MQRKKRHLRHETLLRKNTEEKQNNVFILMSVDRKGTVFPMTLKLKEESVE